MGTFFADDDHHELWWPVSMERTMNTRLTMIGLVALGCTQVGCISHLYSPAARMAPLESARPVGKGKVSTAAAIGHYAEETGFEGTNVSVKLRRGVTEHSEAGLDANVMVGDNSDAASHVDPNIWSARLGGKWAPALLHDWVSLAYGVGGGTSAAGTFVSPDVGVIGAYENPYVVPFVSVDGFVSVPLDPQPVDVSSDTQDPGTNVYTVKTTWGATLAGGVKVPIHLGQMTVAPYVGGSYRLLTDRDKGTQARSLNAGLDVVY